MEELNNNEINQQVSQTSPQREVYVMPEKFRLTKANNSNRGIIISSLILLAVIIITGSYFVYDFWQKSKVSQQSVIKEQPPIIEIQQDEIITTNTLPATETEIIETTSTIITTTEEASTPTSTSNEELKFSLDSDNDGLTDIEEVIFGTTPTNFDTDGDGYKDGVEVINGYSPIKAGNFKVSSSPFIASVITDFDSDNFKIYYPKDWRLSLSKAAKQLVLTINTGEVITITVKDNLDKIPAMSWYLQQYPQTPVSQLRIIDSRDLTGIYTPDGLSAYLTDKDKSKFYIFEYIVGRQQEIRYPTIFNMLIKQIELIPNPIINNSNNSNNSTLINPEFSYTAATCPNFFCAITPCGLQPDGSNSCEDNPPKGACYLNACQSDIDCLNGLSCQEVDCYSGDVLISSKVCK